MPVCGVDTCVFIKDAVADQSIRLSFDRTCVSFYVQYGDFVEVISPDSVIEGIKKKIETLRRKYFKEEDFNEKE